MKVALTAAIADLCHEGHLELFRMMREMADKVVVVIHNDYSCFQIKGKFPIQDEKHRRRNLLMTGLVDEVLITKNTDPTDKFMKVTSNYSDIVFVRGDDNLNFPGKWYIDKHNIPIVYKKYTEGVSSSEIRKYLI